MKEIRDATASEPLTLEEEHSMQRQWRQDADKLTFIACKPPSTEQEFITSKDQDAPEQMVGDVNLFLYISEADPKTGLVGEIELMIAKKVDQRKGWGKATLLAFLAFVTKHEREILAEFVDRSANVLQERIQAPHLEYLRAKIKQGNVRSIRLFEKLGFRKVEDEPNYFNEFELRLQRPLEGAIGDFTSRLGLSSYQEQPFHRGSGYRMVGS